MELRQLRVFQAIARIGSVASAASELHLTPSALSHALKALESEIGCRLFDRIGQRLRLNAAGERFLAEVEPHLAGLASAPEQVRQLVRGGHTRLRLGASASACNHILPKVIRDLQKAFPRLEVRIESGDSAQLIAQVKRYHRHGHGHGFGGFDQEPGIARELLVAGDAAELGAKVDTGLDVGRSRVCV